MMETVLYPNCGSGYTNLHIYKIHGPAHARTHTHSWAGHPQTYRKTPMSLRALTGQRVVG